MRWLISAVLVAAIAGCSGGRFEPPDGALTVAVAARCPDASSARFFFPPKTFSNDDASDLRQGGGFAMVLAASREPSLSCGSEPNEGYRVTVVGVFRKAWTIRVSKKRTGYELVAVEMAGGSDEPTTFEEANRVQKEMANSDWTAIDSAFTNASYWSLQTEDDAAAKRTDRVVFEGRKRDMYHPLYRSTQLEPPPLRSLVQLLVKYSGLSITPDHAGNFGS